MGNKNSHAGEFGFAARYAAALYALAFEAKKLDQVVDEMAALGRLIAESADLRRYIGTPLTDAATAAPVIKSILEKQGFPSWCKISSPSSSTTAGCGTCPCW